MGALPAVLGSLGGVIGLALIAWPVGIWYEVRKCERPKYTVVQTLGTKKGWFKSTHAAEVRLYAPYLIAEVVIQGGDMRDALSSGFRQIAGFIFGKNTAVGSTGAEPVAMTSPVSLEVQQQQQQQNEKIAMTTPVAAELTGNDTYKVSFVMPSKYTMETLPKPHNPNVVIKTVPARTLAAISFSGNSPKEPKVEEYKQELLAALKEAGLVAEEDKWLLWQYHPPFAPGWMRLNEVLVPVKEAAPAATS